MSFRTKKTQKKIKIFILEKVYFTRRGKFLRNFSAKKLLKLFFNIVDKKCDGRL